MEGIRIYGTIPNLLKEQLDKKLEDGEYTMSQVISLALHQYLNPEPVVSYPRSRLTNEPLPLEGIKPGPGVYLRLKALGVDPQKIINAKRARSQGRQWDYTLEQYFNLL
jgi:hypothetical protein